MVGGTPKPFACTSEGCTMTFTNEDHLNVHQKKHDMVLNLGSKCNIIVADQTPTPTRFLRNCEEVGLFQDLQNVNPFEETFRRAVEMVKTGSLPEPDLPEDDTLHTPHVFPHLPAENISCMYKVQNIKKDKITTSSLTRSIDLTIHTSHELSQNDANKEFSEKSDLLLQTHNSNPDHGYSSVVVETKQEKVSKVSLVEDNKISYSKLIQNKKSDNTIKVCPTKIKLQQQILSKNKKQIQIATTNDAQPFSINSINIHDIKIINSDATIQTTIPHVSLVNSLLQTPRIFPKKDTINLPTVKNITSTNTANKRKSSDAQEVDESKRLELLERNRAAAVRCREKKKKRIGSLENRYDIVCQSNFELQKEVVNLRNEVMHLKTLLLAHKECPVTKAMNMGQNIAIGPAHIVSISVPLPKKSSNPDISSGQNKTEKKLESSTTNAATSKPDKTITSPSVIVINDSFSDLNS